MLEYFWIESLKNKTQPLRNGAADQRKLSKELNENAKETDIKVFMVIIYRPGWGKEGGGGRSGGFCLCNDKFTWPPGDVIFSWFLFC